MQRTTLTFLVAFWLPLTAAPAAGPPKPGPRSDLEKMQGTWYRTRFVAGGEVQEEPPGDGTIVIKGTHLQWPTPEDSWTMTLDPTRDPKWFAYRGNISSAKDPLPSNTDIAYRGIYRLEGDTLTICVFRGGKEKQFEKYRPTKFESTPGSGVYLQVFKRKRP